MVNSVYPFVRGRIIEAGEGEEHPQLSCLAQQQKREATVAKLLQNIEDARPFIDSIIQLLKARTGVEATSLNFLKSKQILVQQACGAESGASYEAPGLCFFSLVPDRPQVLVIEDLREDARTAESPRVLEPPYIRFYATAPLVASNQQRIGNLCLLDTKPRQLNTNEAAVLCNLAELLISTLEDAAASNGSRISAMGHAILEVQDGRAVMLGANKTFLQTAGVEESRAVLPCPLEALFPFSYEVEAAMKKLQSGKSQTLSGLASAVGGQFSAILSSISALAAETARPIAIPPSCHKEGTDKPKLDNFQGICIMSTTSKEISCKIPQLPRSLNPCLQLQHLLGVGSFSRVYRGRIGIQRVAIKVVHDLSEAIIVNGSSGEAQSMLRHDNIVKVHQSMITKNASGVRRIWLILEYCNMGNLSDAIEKGLFRESPSSTSPVCEQTIAWTARDLARALHCLHQGGILHCDISGANVLLQSNMSTPHGFSAKLADFGLARKMDGADNLHIMGTHTYASHEVQRGERVTTASEVYSLGVIIFEMLSSRRAWGGLNIFQVHYALIEAKLSLAWDDALGDSTLRSLATACMSPEPSSRPTIVSILQTLDQICRDC